MSLIYLCFLGTNDEHFNALTRLGWKNANTLYPETQTSMDRCDLLFHNFFKTF
jgi:hypothetical protein